MNEASSRTCACCWPTARGSPPTPRAASTATAPSCGARVYSPCDLCKRRPERAAGLADQGARDRSRQGAEARRVPRRDDGDRRLAGVLHALFLDPDPSVKRASGFLPPSIGNSSTIGAHVTIPYYWVLGPDKDLTLAPRFTTEAGAVLAGEYRQALQQRRCSTPSAASITATRRPARPTTPAATMARPHQRHRRIWISTRPIAPASTLQRVSDQTYLLRFGFGNPPLNADDQPRLSRRLRAARLDRCQRLRCSSRCCPASAIRRSRSSCRSPTATGRASPTRSAAGGSSTPICSTSCARSAPRPGGCRSAREWDRTFRDGIGGQYKFSASLRGDGYSVNDLSPMSNPDLPTAYFPVNGAPPAEPIATNLSTGRVFPQVGLTWSYPLIHRGERRHAADRADRRRLTPRPPAATGARSRTRTASRSNIDDTDLFRRRPAGRLRHSRYRPAGRLRRSSSASTTTTAAATAC